MPAREAIRTRSTLLNRLREPDDAAAWEEFYATYGGLIRRLALKAGLRDDEASDVVQDVFVGVSRNIGEFEYDRSKCSFKHWLTRMVKWRIADRRERRMPVEPGGLVDGAGVSSGTEEAEPVIPSELEAVWDIEWHRHRLEMATRRLKDLVDPQQFQMFYLYVLKEMAVTEVARRLHVSVGRVYLTKFRVGKTFRRLLKSVQDEEEVGGGNPRWRASDGREETRAGGG